MRKTHYSGAIRIECALVYGGLGMFAGFPFFAVAPGGTWENAGAAACVLLAAAGAWRGATVRVVEDKTGLVVRNVFRTHFVRWSDLEGVRIELRRAYRVDELSMCPCLVVAGQYRPVRLIAMAMAGRTAKDQVWSSGDRFIEAVGRWRGRVAQ